MSALTLWQRLALLFAALMSAFAVGAAWLQASAMSRQGQQIEQQLARPLAAKVAADLAAEAAGRGLPLLGNALKMLSPAVLAAHPGVELYVLDASGQILSRQPQVRPLQRHSVDLAPVLIFLGGAAEPILGDDPLDTGMQAVFSAAMVRPDDAAPGYVYAVLKGRNQGAGSTDARLSALLPLALWAFGAALPVGLLALAWATSPLARLAREVVAEQTAGNSDVPTGRNAPRDEVTILRTEIEGLTVRHAQHGRRAAEQDQGHREWVVAMSHDLRTPLASLQGYLETLLAPAAELGDAGREQYLRAALAQCQQLSRLAAEMLELARLELGTVKPTLERFSMVELVSDVMQKLALTASSRDQVLVPDFAPGPLDVLADIGMIEQVVTSLIDNAIRYPPPGGEVNVRVRLDHERVCVEVADRGPGIPLAIRSRLLARDAQGPTGRDGSGLGLAIVRLLLKLHGSDIALQDGPAGGAVLSFQLRAQTSVAESPVQTTGTRRP